MEPPERPLALANLRYPAHAEALNRLDLAGKFSYIYRHNVWGSSQSNSGVGSQLDATQILRDQIPKLLGELGARTLLDLPCGDFGWLSHAKLDLDYIGADIVPEIVERNQHQYGSTTRRFIQLDLAADPLPEADVVLCRDCLVHFSFATVFRAFANLQRSGCTYLLATTFPVLRANRDIADGDWWAQNLQAAPFNLPQPLHLIVEGCTEEGGAYADKSLGLWRVCDLP
jgi:hypothetical protein